MKIMYIPQTTQRAHTTLRTHRKRIPGKSAHTIIFSRRRHNHHTHHWFIYTLTHLATT